MVYKLGSVAKGNEELAEKTDARDSPGKSVPLYRTTQCHLQKQLISHLQNKFLFPDATEY